MYTANKRQRRYRIFLRFMLLMSPILIAIFALFWFIFMREPKIVTTSFNREGAQVAFVKPATKNFTNNDFKITLRSSWEYKGKLNPASDQVFHEFQDKPGDNSHGILRVYVDVFPRDFAINRLLPINIADNKIQPGAVSDDCKNFTGAPQAVNGQISKQVADTWNARWQGIDFICAIKAPRNYVGTASADEGIATTFIDSSGKRRKYFFLYIDQNVRPDYTIFTDALKSFETL